MPQSSTSNVPASVRTDTHDVLPPYRTVVGPALAIEPRVPQNVTCTRLQRLISVSNTNPGPELVSRAAVVAVTSSTRSCRTYGERDLILAGLSR